MEKEWGDGDYGSHTHGSVELPTVIINSMYKVAVASIHPL